MIRNEDSEAGSLKEKKKEITYTLEFFTHEIQRPLKRYTRAERFSSKSRKIASKEVVNVHYLTKKEKKNKKSDKNALHKCVFVTKIGSYWVSHQLHTIHLLHTSKFKTEKPCTSVSLRTDSSDFIYFLTSQTKA